MIPAPKCRWLNSVRRFCSQEPNFLESEAQVVVASPQQTGVQLNLNPSWTDNGTSITFIATNPLNMSIGGTPRYWLAQNVETVFAHPQIGPQPGVSLSPITAPMSHIIAVS